MRRYVPYPEFRVADEHYVKPEYKGMNVRERKNKERGDQADAQVCLNCTLKKCRGSEECFQRMRKAQEAKKVGA